MPIKITSSIQNIDNELVENILSKKVSINSIKKTNTSYEQTIVEILSKEPNLYCKLSAKKKTNIRFMTVALSNGLDLSHIPKSFRADDKLVKLAVEKKGSNLIYASKRFRCNSGYIWLAYKTCPNILMFEKIYIDLSYDELLRVVKKTPYIIEDYPEYNNDKKLILSAVSECITCLKYASDELKNDIDIVETAINNNIHAIKHAGKIFKSNKELMKDLAKIDSTTFANASQKLKGDKKYMLEMIEIDPYIIKFASSKLKKDFDVVIAAVKKNPIVYHFLGNYNHLYNKNKEIMLLVASVYGKHFISDDLIFDKDINSIADKCEKKYNIKYDRDEYLRDVIYVKHDTNNRCFQCKSKRSYRERNPDEKYWW